MDSLHEDLHGFLLAMGSYEVNRASTSGYQSEKSLEQKFLVEADTLRTQYAFHKQMRTNASELLTPFCRNVERGYGNAFFFTSVQGVCFSPSHCYVTDCREVCTPSCQMQIQYLRPWPLPSTSLSVHYLLIILPLLTASLTLRRRIKSHLLFAGIIRSSPFSLR